MIELINHSVHPGYIDLEAKLDTSSVGSLIALQVGKSMHIEKIHVLDSARNRGVGGALLNEAEKIAIANSATSMWGVGTFCDTGLFTWMDSVNFFRHKGYAWSIIALSKKLERSK